MAAEPRQGLATLSNLTLPPRQVTVIALRQLEKLNPIHHRADLALAAPEVSVTENRVTGVVHNLGARAVPDVAVALVNADGKILARESLGAVDAPLDLRPRRKCFSLPLSEPHPAAV
jgi:hypothetical protein